MAGTFLPWKTLNRLTVTLAQSQARHLPFNSFRETPKVSFCSSSLCIRVTLRCLLRRRDIFQSWLCAKASILAQILSASTPPRPDSASTRRVAESVEGSGQWVQRPLQRELRTAESKPAVYRGDTSVNE